MVEDSDAASTWMKACVVAPAPLDRGVGARAGGDMGGEAEREGRGRGRAEVRAYARSSAACEWREHRLEQTEIATMQDEQDRLCARVCAVPDHSVSSVQIPRKATSTCRVCMSMNQ